MKGKKAVKKEKRPAANMLEVSERYDKPIRDLVRAHATLFRKMDGDGVSPLLICATMFVTHAALAHNVINASQVDVPEKGKKK